ncbi:hypothetical protein C2869_00640 [Saccharobesus litoralis]|uniref:Secreted protein n=1 Tax=Saccharobesus litoralis TaxID=2172099 RepID=A0A2S0VLF5_9ALTE|nr:hypothetical protein [Saccharobesus litoralis]AWB65038.1 hypothetical protein C2869_00640 [Saccharobesus litoralis]
MKKLPITTLLLAVIALTVFKLNAQESNLDSEQSVTNEAPYKTVSSIVEKCLEKVGNSDDDLSGENGQLTFEDTIVECTNSQLKQQKFLLFDTFGDIVSFIQQYRD